MNLSVSVIIKKTKQCGFEKMCFNFLFPTIKYLKYSSFTSCCKKSVYNEVKLFFLPSGQTSVKCSTAEVLWKECYLVIIMIISEH